MEQLIHMKCHHFLFAETDDMENNRTLKLIFGSQFNEVMMASSAIMHINIHILHLLYYDKSTKDAVKERNPIY